MGWGKCLGIELRWQVHGLGQVFGNRIEVASTWVGGKCLGIELRWQVHGLGQVFGKRIEVASTWVGASVWE